MLINSIKPRCLLNPLEKSPSHRWRKKSAKALLAKMAAADGRLAWLICSTSFFHFENGKCGTQKGHFITRLWIQLI